MSDQDPNEPEEAEASEAAAEEAEASEAAAEEAEASEAAAEEEADGEEADGEEPENGGSDTAVGSGPDSEPTPVETSEPSVEAPPSPPPLPTGWRLALQLALPIIVVAGAVGVHWAINVPDHIVESRRDQGAKKKKKKQQQRRRRPSDTRARDEPRTAAVLDEAWKRWQGHDFDDEPVLARWARRHQAVISRVFVDTRRAAFEGAEEPAATLVRPKCKTIRCRFVVRSPFPHELDRMDDALGHLQLDGEDLWRSYESKRVEPPDAQPANQHYMQVTAAFSVDDPDPESISLAEPEPTEGADEPEGESPDADEPKPKRNPATGGGH